MNTWSSGPVPAGAVSVLLSVGLLAGCSADILVGENPPPGALSQTQVPDLTSVREEILRLARQTSGEHGGRVGIAVATSEGVVHVGLTGNTYAWSTVKVPVAVVADQRELAMEELIEASISISDNDAAYQLSQAIDLDLGDLPHAPILEPLPGETRWPLADQAQFAAELPCLDTVGTTYAAMGEIVDWQQFGLAQIPGAHFKGGWGSETPEVYTLRQLATVPVGEGVVGIAVITHPDDASHDTAVDILDDIGSGLADLIAADAIGPAVTCRA